MGNNIESDAFVKAFGSNSSKHDIYHSLTIMTVILLPQESFTNIT